MKWRNDRRGGINSWEGALGLEVWSIEWLDREQEKNWMYDEQEIVELLGRQLDETDYEALRSYAQAGAER